MTVIARRRPMQLRRTPVERRPGHWREPPALRDTRQLEELTSYGTVLERDQPSANVDLAYTVRSAEGGQVTVVIEVKAPPAWATHREYARSRGLIVHGLGSVGSYLVEALARGESLGSYPIEPPMWNTVGDVIGGSIPFVTGQAWNTVGDVIGGSIPFVPGQAWNTVGDVIGGSIPFGIRPSGEPSNTVESFLVDVTPAVQALTDVELPPLARPGYTAETVGIVDAPSHVPHVEVGSDTNVAATPVIGDEPLVIRYFRELGRWLGLSDAELARVLGLGRTTFYSWRRGHVPQARSVRRVYRAHAPVAAVMQTLGEEDGLRWLHAGSPSPADLVIEGALDAVSSAADDVVFRGQRRQNLTAWRPEEPTSAVETAAPRMRPRSRRRSAGK